MKNSILFYFAVITLFLTIFLATPLCLHAQSDEKPIYQSFQTITFIRPQQVIVLTEEERNDFIKRVSFTLKKHSDDFNDKSDPHGVRSIFKDKINPFVDLIPIPDGGVLGKLRDKWYEHREAANSPFKIEKQFQDSKSLTGYAAELRKKCDNNIDCITDEATKVVANPEIQKRLGNDLLPVFDKAILKQLLIASASNDELNHEETMDKFSSLEAFSKEGFSMVLSGLEEVKEGQQKIYRNTAKIIHIQQEHTIALIEIQKTIDENQVEIRKRLEQGFGEVKELQVQNLFLTQMVLENTKAMEGQLIDLNEKVDDLGEAVNVVRQRQLKQIFDESPTKKKLELLKGEEGKEMFNDPKKTPEENEKARRSMIQNTEKLIKKEQIVNVTKKVREWGTVGKEALNVLCKNCPSEISEGLDMAMAASDIVGGITSGNWSTAIMAGLSFFKKPEPGPEMKMLQQISQQLTSLESNMNDQFKDVHSHLFAMEDNIVSRLEIVDQKLDIISSQIEFTYTELSSQLSTIENKTNYIIRQNDCTQDLILNIVKNGAQDVCKIPVQEFKKRKAGGLIQSFSDLNAFFVGSLSCKECVEALRKISGPELENITAFRYSDCKTTSDQNKNRPEKLYEFTFNNLISNYQKSNPYDLFSILFVPDNVITASSIMDTINVLPDSIKIKIKASFQNFKLVENDKFYRNYEAVLEFVDYTLTMMPFLELYDNGALLTYEKLSNTPSLSKERAKAIILLLDNMDALLDRTIFQQSLMTGMGSFKAVDSYVKNGKVSSSISDGSEVVLQNLFDYNPFFNKNFSTYFIDKNYGGVKGLRKVLASNTFTTSGTHKKINNDFKSTISKDNNGNLIVSVSTSSRYGNKYIFSSYIPDLKGTDDDPLIYDQYLLYAIPSSLKELFNAKNQTNSLRSEMKFLLSGDIDKPNAKFTRKDLNVLIQESKY